jgi:DNA-binding MarR family transcriptional regulator
MLVDMKSSRVDQMSQLDALHRLQERSLGYVLIRCGQRFNELGVARVNAEAGETMLREAHTRLLPHLQAPEGVRVTDLARTLGVTKQAVQQLVADLRLRGVVTLRPDPEDARARRVVLTDLGVQAMLHGTGVLLGLEREVAPRLGRSDVRALRRLLGRLLTVLEALPASDGSGPRRAPRRPHPGRGLRRRALQPTPRDARAGSSRIGSSRGPAPR